MRRVLLVSYHFPPDAEVGAIRIQKLVKFLPQYGWIPYVLTVKSRYYPIRDVTGLQDVEGCRVSRTVVWPNPLKAVMMIRSRLNRLLGRRSALAKRVLLHASITWEQKQQVKPGLWGTIVRMLLSLRYLPDEYLGWVPPAVVRGIFMCRRERIEALVTSGPPHTGHLIGLWLKGLSGIHWVADFRDPWAGNPCKPRFVRTAFSDWCDRMMEQAVVRSAGYVVLNTDRACHTFTNSYSEQPESKFVTIWNGFDPDDFVTSNQVTESIPKLVDIAKRLPVA